MAGRKSDFTLPTLDDLFSTQEMRDDAKLAKIRDIPLELIDDFPDHPFKVRDDEDMMQLVESIKERGVITPATVRQKENGRYGLPNYEPCRKKIYLPSKPADFYADGTYRVFESRFRQYGKRVLFHLERFQKGLKDRRFQKGI